MPTLLAPQRRLPERTAAVPARSRERIKLQLARSRRRNALRSSLPLELCGNVSSRISAAGGVTTAIARS